MTYEKANAEIIIFESNGFMMFSGDSPAAQQAALNQALNMAQSDPEMLAFCNNDQFQIHTDKIVYNGDGSYDVTCYVTNPSGNVMKKSYKVYTVQ